MESKPMMKIIRSSVRSRNGGSDIAKIAAVAYPTAYSAVQLTDSACLVRATVFFSPEELRQMIELLQAIERDVIATAAVNAERAKATAERVAANALKRSLFAPSALPKLPQ